MRHHNVCRTFQQLRPSWFSSPVEMRQNKPKESEMQRNKCTVQSKNNTATIKNHLFISMGIFSYKKRTISPHHFWRFHRVVRRGERERIIRDLPFCFILTPANSDSGMTYTSLTTTWNIVARGTNFGAENQRTSYGFVLKFWTKWVKNLKRKVYLN